MATTEYKSKRFFRFEGDERPDCEVIEKGDTITCHMWEYDDSGNTCTGFVFLDKPDGERFIELEVVAKQKYPCNVGFEFYGTANYDGKLYSGDLFVSSKVPADSILILYHPAA